MRAMLLKRHALDLIVDHLGFFRVIALTGARQVGKSTRKTFSWSLLNQVSSGTGPDFRSS